MWTPQLTLAQTSALLAAVPVGADFQFDVLPDGNLGPTFTVDVRFGVERPTAVLKPFAHA